MRLDDLKEALNISGLEDFHSVRFPDGRREHGLGDLFEQLEEVVSHGHRILSLLLCFLEEVMQGGIHLIHQFIDSLGFKLGCHEKERFTMGGEFHLAFSVKDSRMISDPVPLDHDFEMVRIGQDLAGPVGIRGGNGVTIGLKLDKTGFADGGQDDPIGTVGDSRKGFERFFLQGHPPVLSPWPDGFSDSAGLSRDLTFGSSP